MDIEERVWSGTRGLEQHLVAGERIGEAADGKQHVIEAENAVDRRDCIGIQCDREVLQKAGGAFSREKSIKPSAVEFEYFCLAKLRQNRDGGCG